MKHLIALVIVTAASSAAAAPFALDYRASDPSCIDGARFSDEVSAKLGFVPWDSAAAAKIRVRVERDGEQFTGTFLNADGSSKVIDGKTCADVTKSLVVTVATAVDTTPKAVPAAAPAHPDVMAAGLIPVTFHSVENRRLSIAVQKAAGYGVASNGTTVAAAYFDNLCTSPCTAGLPAGRSYLTFVDPDDSSIGGGGFVIDRPSTITLAHKSRHGVRVGMVLGGAVAAGAGAYWLSAGDGAGAIVGGTTLVSLGLTSMLYSLFVHDTFTATQTP